jgi:hypothetical protein
MQQMNKPITSGADGGFNFSEVQNKDLKALKAKEYQEELQRQMREKQLAKQREKDEQERLEKKAQVEAAVYNPFGRAGGGAPLKDKEGNVVADLSQARADPSQLSPRAGVTNIPITSNNHSNLNASNGNNRSTEMLAYLMSQQQPGAPNNFDFDTNRNKQPAPQFTNGVGDPSFARGNGNGIFGEAKVIIYFTILQID